MTAIKIMFRVILSADTKEADWKKYLAKDTAFIELFLKSIEVLKTVEGKLTPEQINAINAAIATGDDVHVEATVASLVAPPPVEEPTPEDVLRFL